MTDLLVDQDSCSVSLHGIESDRTLFKFKALKCLGHGLAEACFMQKCDGVQG
jgi:hypothetical protein